MARRFANRRAILANRGVAAFSPSDIAGLKMWVDASDSTTLFQDSAKTTPAGDTDVVGAWADKSGQVNDLLQATTAKKATLHTNVQNSLPVVRFDGGDDWIRVAALAGGPFAQPTTQFIVAKVAAITSVTKVFMSGIDAALSRQSIYTSNADVWAIVAGTVLATLTGADTSWHIFSAVYNGVNSFLRLDGTQIAAGDAGALPQTGITLGAGSGLTANADCDIGEGHFYNNEVSNDNIIANEQYLATKWGISLP